MIDYNKRAQEAFEMIPSQRQKEILEDLESKAYKQSFNNPQEDNILSLIADSTILLGKLGSKWIKDSIEGAKIIKRELKGDNNENI